MPLISTATDLIVHRAPAGSVPVHFDGDRFFNFHADTDKSLADIIRFYRAPRTAWPAPSPAAPADAPARSVTGGIAVTYVGQATMLVQTAGLNILTDPVFSERIGPLPWLGPKRHRPAAPDYQQLPPIHLVLVSHDHYDHLDLPSLRNIARDHRCPVLTGLGNGARLARAGFQSVAELDWFDRVEMGEVEISFVPAQHWSSRMLVDRRRTLWGGFYIKASAGSVMFAGDTAFAPLFAHIRDRLGAPDVALLPIGAYEPRWFMEPQHMNPDDAVRAHRDIGASVSLAFHFGTFNLSAEGRDEPIEKLARALTSHGVGPESFIVPEFGRPYRFDPFP